MRKVVQPGPVTAERREVALARGRPIEVTLKAGPLESAVFEAVAAEGCDGAWLEIADTPVASLDYVIPALSPDEDHVAWYSEIHSLGGPGRIERLGMMIGREGTAPTLHGHGLWFRDGQAPAMGHVLPDRTELAEPVVARGIGVQGTCFQRQPDPETNFTLFRPATCASPQADANVAFLRLLPNQDLSEAIDRACAGLRWDRAAVHGIGSLIEARFADGRVLNSLPTEFLILSADADAEGQARPGPEIAIVGIEGTEVMKGRLERGNNPVLITAELILVREEG